MTPAPRLSAVSSGLPSGLLSGLLSGLSLCLLSCLPAAATVQPAPGVVPAPADYTLHEWGTFTTVSGPDGAPLTWAPLQAISDLPGFVYASKMVGKGGLATVRMETPVIYLYSDAPRTVSVQVDFPQGRLTEWYPAAEPGDDARSLRWPAVQIGAAGEPPDDGQPSHYYPARQAGADRLRVEAAPGTWETEDFLFYRGIASFQPAMRFRVEGGVVHREDWHPAQTPAPSASPAPERPFLVFRREGDRAGWLRGAGEQAQIPALTGTAAAGVAALKADLRAMLTGAGLYAPEADAMLATWEGDWFEAGLRVLWLYDTAETDAVLPLTADPPPASRCRVLVGRTELISAEMEAEAQRILTAARSAPQAEAEILARFGRFADPILQVAAARLPEADRARLARLGLVWQRRGQAHAE